MSFFRRLIVLSAVAASLVMGGAAASAVAAPSVTPTASFPGGDGYHGGRPIHFGPFEIPHNGQVSGGFGWETNNGGGGGLLGL
ncbi:hypothetical protein ACSNOH_10450 [Streptomyces sp. URMC 127]|uniref:hypothetical protein n=1 Tax=Streptomyces sp. URMC 127 TaxID=3423402 RepID=UPI003F1D5013